jgi:hypothetical protein
VSTIAACLEAFARGAHDAERERPPIFRSTTRHGIVPTVDDDAADAWDDDARRAYIGGYDAARP